MNRPDEHLEGIEQTVLAGILVHRSPADRLSVLAVHCPPPLWRYFGSRNRQALGLALDAAISGETGADGGSISDWLAATPLAYANDVLAGRDAKPSARLDAAAYPDSALAWIGGFNAVTDHPAAVMGASDRRFADCCRMLRNAFSRREASAALQALSDRIAKTSLSDGCAGTLAAGLDAVSRIVGDTRAKTIGDHLSAVIDSPDGSAQVRSGVASWGLPELDEACRLDGGRLYVLAAAPGAGKTSLALQALAATAPASGSRTAAIVSLEMGGGELATILAGRALGIAPVAIRDRSPSLTDEQWTALHTLRDEWRAAGTLWVRECGQADTTPGDLVAWACERHTAARGTFSLLVIDYCQLVGSSDLRATEYSRICATTRACKRIAMTLSIPVLLLSQLSRDGRKASRGKDGRLAANPEPRLEDLRGSGSLEQDADAVVFVHRPSPERSARIPVELHVAKNRSGPTGVVPASFLGRHQLFVSERPDGASAGRAERLAATPSERENVF